MGKGARSHLARTVRVLRVAQGWSQEDLANASGLHRTHISLIERCACSVTIDNMERLAETFGIDLPELLGAPAPKSLGAFANRKRARRKVRSR